MSDAKSQVIDRTRAMKRRDIENCARCGKGLMACGFPSFARVTFEPMIVELGAVQRRHGLEQFFGGGTGGAVLAEVMGDNADLAVPVGNALTGLICGSCALDPEFCLAELSGVLRVKAAKVPG